VQRNAAVTAGLTARQFYSRCPVNMAHLRQSKPDSGHGSHVKVCHTF
jgi:hypothetical protein